MLFGSYAELIEHTTKGLSVPPSPGHPTLRPDGSCRPACPEEEPSAVNRPFSSAAPGRSAARRQSGVRHGFRPVDQVNREPELYQLSHPVRGGAGLRALPLISVRPD